MTIQDNTIFIAANIGPSFLAELEEANLAGLPFSFTQQGITLPQNTDAQTVSAVQALIANHNSTDVNPYEYRIERAKAYPQISDQMDEVMKWIATSSDASIPASLSAIADACMAVKASFPKPS